MANAENKFPLPPLIVGRLYYITVHDNTRWRNVGSERTAYKLIRTRPCQALSRVGQEAMASAECRTPRSSQQQEDDFSHFEPETAYFMPYDKDGKVMEEKYPWSNNQQHTVEPLSISVKDTDMPKDGNPYMFKYVKYSIGIEIESDGSDRPPMDATERGRNRYEYLKPTAVWGGKQRKSRKRSTRKRSTRRRA